VLNICLRSSDPARLRRCGLRPHEARTLMWPDPLSRPANEPPTMIKKPDRLSGDQAPDLHFLVAGAGFEPATSGL